MSFIQKIKEAIINYNPLFRKGWSLGSSWNVPKEEIQQQPTSQQQTTSGVGQPTFNEVVIRQVPPMPSTVEFDKLIAKPTNVVSDGVVSIPTPSSLQSISKGIDEARFKISKIQERLNELINQKVIPVEKVNVSLPLNQESDLNGDVINRWEKIKEKYKIDEKRTEIENARNRINAILSSFDEIINEQANLGGVPQSIRQKRINYLLSQRDKRQRDLENMLKLLEGDYEKSLELAKQEMGLIEKQGSKLSSERERRIDNTRAMITQLINSGAIGNLSDDDLLTLANDSGYSLNTLREIRKSVKTGNENKLNKALLDLEREKLLIEKTRKSLSEEPKSVLKDRLQTYLVNQGLPLNIIDASGNLTVSALQGVISSGVPLQIAKGIWRNMVAGNSFEEIRSGMRREGIDTSYLDKFVLSLQKMSPKGGAYSWEKILQEAKTIKQDNQQIKNPFN